MKEHLHKIFINIPESEAGSSHYFYFYHNKHVFLKESSGVITIMHSENLDNFYAKLTLNGSPQRPCLSCSTEGHLGHGRVSGLEPLGRDPPLTPSQPTIHTWLLLMTKYSFDLTHNKKLIMHIRNIGFLLSYVTYEHKSRCIIKLEIGNQ